MIRRPVLNVHKTLKKQNLNFFSCDPFLSLGPDISVNFTTARPGQSWDYFLLEPFAIPSEERRVAHHRKSQLQQAADRHVRVGVGPAVG